MHRIVREAVDLEHNFCCEALSCALVGMNAQLMGQYIDYVADRLLVALGYDKLYQATNPFDWMEMISLQVCASDALHKLLFNYIILRAELCHVQGSKCQCHQLQVVCVPDRSHVGGNPK